MQRKRVRIVHERFEQEFERPARVVPRFEMSRQRQACAPVLRIGPYQLAEQLREAIGAPILA